MDLSSRLTAWRKAKGMTQRQIADAANVTVSAVCLWEKGGNLTTSHLAAVVSALGLSMVEFYGPIPADSPSERVA